MSDLNLPENDGLNKIMSLSDENMQEIFNNCSLMDIDDLLNFMYEGVIDND